MRNTIIPYPMVASWSEELATAITLEIFGSKHGPQCIREQEQIREVCSEYLQQFWDASEHKAIAEMGIKMGYDACKDDVAKMTQPYIDKALDLYATQAHVLNSIRFSVQQLDFKKREIVIEEGGYS